MACDAAEPNERLMGASDCCENLTLGTDLYRPEAKRTRPLKKPVSEGKIVVFFVVCLFGGEVAVFLFQFQAGPNRHQTVVKRRTELGLEKDPVSAEPFQKVLNSGRAMGHHEIHFLFFVSLFLNSDCLQPNCNGLQPTCDGLQPTSKLYSWKTP